MYIEPNSTIKLYHNIPLDNTYEHTLYFASLSAQNSYFHGGSNVKYTLTAQSYQRVVKGKMRVGIKADNIYDCNYLAFQNVNFGNKWFYAFITGVEYINNETSEVTFEIDDMQTYFFDVELGKCFVEREHSSTDQIGDNIQPESVSIGEYITSDYQLIKSLIEYVFIVATVDENTVAGNMYEGIYSGATLTAFKQDDISSLNSFLQSFIQQPEQVLSVYVCPKEIINVTVATGGTTLPPTSSATRFIITLNSVSQESQDFGGYTPKNKKLYTYPYNFVSIENAKGESLNLRYEFFDNLTPVIELTSVLTSPVQIVARPCSYKGLPSYTELGGYTSSKSECIKLDNYPLCSWANDAYKRWVAQKTLPLLISSAGKTISGAMRFGGIGGALSGISSIMNIINQQYQASIEADECRGNISDANVNVSNRYQNFYKVRTHITKNYAMVIDNFFNMFGYATNLVKFPNRNVRPHWCYVKTNRCIITKGNAPAESIKNICSIYDKGITFWKNASEVGDYSLDNSLV